ncbi:MAG: hypothetical protein R3D71_01510 [Rickettsiales bacterium]
MKRYIVIFFYIIFCPKLALASNYDWESLGRLKCDFDYGTFYDGTNVRTNKKPLGGDIIIIDAINLTTKSVRMTGKIGRNGVKILDDRELLVLGEKTVSGSWIFTSISPRVGKWFDIAVSQHSLVSGKPLFSQSYGNCSKY